MNFLDVLLGRPAKILIAGSGGGVFSGRFNERDDSHLLGHQPAANPHLSPILYFRHTKDGYQLYVRSPGGHFGKAISRGSQGEIGAFSTERTAPARFELLGAYGPLTLADMTGDSVACMLRERASGHCLHLHRRHDSRHTYLFASYDAKLHLKLTILERNAAWLNHPDEI
ncbi:hypothetical protein ACIPW4_25260 [Pseudomonas sp. NPDC089996]|uniref:hypothetical protein n=1 Tax=Pseudomonas sp. NPDC089996 TaxID=3364474 RepID=UPI00380C15DC